MNTRDALKRIFEHYGEELANLDDVIEDIITVVDEECRYQVDNVLDIINDDIKKLQENIDYCREKHGS